MAYRDDVAIVVVADDNREISMNHFSSQLQNFHLETPFSLVLAFPSSRLHFFRCCLIFLHHYFFIATAFLFCYSIECFLHFEQSESVYWIKLKRCVYSVQIFKSLCGENKTAFNYWNSDKLSRQWKNTAEKKSHDKTVKANNQMNPIEKLQLLASAACVSFLYGV